MRRYKNSTIKNQKFSIGVRLVAPFILLLAFACGGIKESSSAEDIKDFQELSELVNTREFEIEHEWLMPQGGSMINLIGNPNYIRFKGDSVDVFLPYFGVRHSGGGYGGDGGIIYKGPAKKLNITQDTDKENILINFEGQQNGENLEFFITLFPGGNATTSVSSSQRQSISYRGDIKKLPEEKR